MHEGSLNVAERFSGYPCDYLAPSVFAKWWGGHSRAALHGSDAPGVGAAGWKERGKVGRMVGGRDDRAPQNARVEPRRSCVRREVQESGGCAGGASYSRLPVGGNGRDNDISCHYG